MTIQVEFLQLAAVLTPLFIGMFAGVWALLHRLVFRPLDKISQTLEKMRDIQVVHEIKLEKLEERVEHLEIKT
jgi:hypothetical protein